MNENVSIPKQTRSIEKKNKIKEAGFKLICQKGYFNTNTVEIAKEAGVSTGIVYRYFKDKKQIFVEAILDSFADFLDSFNKVLDSIEDSKNLEEKLTMIVDYAVDSHVHLRKAQDEINALAHYDQEFKTFLEKKEDSYIRKIAERLCAIGFNETNIYEKIYIVFNLLENYIHEVAFSKKANKDYDYIKKSIINISINLLQN